MKIKFDEEIKPKILSKEETQIFITLKEYEDLLITKGRYLQIMEILNSKVIVNTSENLKKYFK